MANLDEIDATLDRAEAASMLDISPRTLDRLREMGDGPAWFRVGEQIKYRRSAVVAWIESQERRANGDGDGGGGDGSDGGGGDDV